MWMLFFGEARRGWVEHALVALAIALVVAGLVAQRAITASAGDSVHELAHHLGRNMLVLPSSADLGDFYSHRFGPAAIAESSPDRIRASPLAVHIRGIEARLYGDLEVNGVRVLIVGEGLGNSTVDHVETASLGPEAARALGLAPGGRLRIGDATFSIDKVVQPPPDGLDFAVFMPLASAQHLLGRPGELSALRLSGCWCRLDVAVLAKDVEKLLPGTRAITVAGMLAAQKGTLAVMQRYSGLLNGAGILAVGVIVATLVTSQVRRRTRELGLLAAIGAKPNAIARLFALEAALAGAMGGLIGWLLSIPITRYLGHEILGKALSPPVGLLGPAILLAALVSVAAAFLPARRAAGLDPTVALREV